MDINFKMAQDTFNYRVAAIIKYNDKYLVNKHLGSDYTTLIGGRVQLGESSFEALKREIYEETNEEVDIKEFLGVIENFFPSHYDNTTYHELLFLYRVEFKDKKVYLLDKINNLEEKDSYYTFKTIDELKELTFEPKYLLNKLDSTSLFHYINK